MAERSSAASRGIAASGGRDMRRSAMLEPSSYGSRGTAVGGETRACARAVPGRLSRTEGALFVKICGLRAPAGVGAAVEAGADAVGFILVPGVRRRVSPERARELGRLAAALRPGILRVGVFRGQSPAEVAELAHAAGVDAIQVYEEATALTLRDRFHVLLAWDGQGRPPLQSADRLLCDPGGGGRGRTWDWSAVRGLPVILAGGLTPDNVRMALEAARPLGVDVSSGVETNGSKDLAKIRAFCANVRGWGNGCAAG